MDITFKIIIAILVSAAIIYLAYEAYLWIRADQLIAEAERILGSEIDPNAVSPQQQKAADFYSEQLSGN